MDKARVKRCVRLVLWLLVLAGAVPLAMTGGATLGLPGTLIILVAYGLPVCVGALVLSVPAVWLAEKVADRARPVWLRILSGGSLAAGLTAVFVLLLGPVWDPWISPVYPAVREQLAYMPQIEAYWAEHREELEVEAEQSGMEHWPRGRPLGHGEDPGRLLMLDMDLVGGTNTHAFVSLVRYSAPHGLEGPWQVGRTNYEAPLDETWTVLIEYYPPD